MHEIFGDAELVPVTLLVPMTMNDEHFEANATLEVPADLAKAWAAAGIASPTSE